MALVKVYNKKRGTYGWLPEENINDNYIPVDQQAQQVPPPPQEQAPGFLGSLVKPFTNTGQRIGGGIETLMKEFLIGQSERARQAGGAENLSRAEELARVAATPTRLTEDEAYRKKMTNPLQIAKDTAGVLSWGVPVGGATKAFGFPIAASVGKGGLLSGAAGGFGYSEAEDVGGLARDTAIGGATGYATAKVLNKLLGGKADELSKGTGKQGAVSRKASENLLDMSADDFLKAKELGIDPRKIVSKYVSPANNYGEILGQLDGQLTMHEGNIQRVLLQNGDEIISMEPSITALKGIRDKLGKIPTNTDKVSRLNEVILALEKNPNIAAKDALSVVRAANEQFGRAIIQEEKGAVNTQINKILANNLRSTLKSRFTDIADNLEAQHELLVLKPILEKADARVSTSGTKALARFELTRPQALVHDVLKQPAVSSRMMGSTQQVPQELPGINQKMQSFLAGRAPALAGSQASKAVTPTDYIPSDQEISSITKTEDISDKVAARKKFQQAMLTDLAAGGKNIDKLQKVYEFMYGSEGGPQATAKDYYTAKSGVRAVNEVRQMLQADPGLLTKQLSPGKFASRTFDATLYNMTDALLRIRTGAQANDEEIRGYMKRLAPSFGDTQEDIDRKLRQYEAVFKDVLGE